jgi:hypothetical protein
MKGISLPVNVIVIMILVLVVFMAVAVLFLGGWHGHASTISDVEALQEGCARWMEMGCKIGKYVKGGAHLIPFILINGYDPNGDGFSSQDVISKDGEKIPNDGTLREACKRVVYGKEPKPGSHYEHCEMALTCQQYCCGKQDYETIDDCEAKT